MSPRDIPNCRWCENQPKVKNAVPLAPFFFKAHFLNVEQLTELSMRADPTEASKACKCMLLLGAQGTGSDCVYKKPSGEQRYLENFKECLPLFGGCHRKTSQTKTRKAISLVYENKETYGPSLPMYTQGAGIVHEEYPCAANVLPNSPVNLMYYSSEQSSLKRPDARMTYSPPFPGRGPCFAPEARN